MMQISNTRYQSPVKIISTAVIFFTLALGLPAHSQNNDSNTTNSGSSQSNTSNSGNSQSNNQNSTGNDSQNGNACVNLSSQVSTALSKMGEACKKAGFGAECTMSALECDEVAEEEGPSTFSQLASLIPGASGLAGALSGANGETSGSGVCPQYNAKDYKDTKADLQKQIREVEKDLKDTNEEIIEANSEYDKASLEIKKALDKAEKDYKEFKRDLEKDEQQQISEFLAAQQEARAKLRSVTSNILNVQGQMTVALRQKATDLLTVTVETSKAACMAEVHKLRTEYTKLVGKSTNYMTGAKNKRALLISTYNVCMEKFDKQRTAIIQNSKQQVAVLQDQLRGLEEEQKGIKDMIDAAESQLNQIKASNQTAISEGLESLIKSSQDSQTELANMYKATQSKVANLNNHISNLEKRLNELNTQIGTMGPVPKSGTGYTPNEAASEIQSQLNNLDLYAGTAQSIPGCTQVPAMIERAKKTYGGRSGRSSGSR